MHNPRVLACGQMRAIMKPAGEQQIGTGIQRPLMKPGLDGLARLLGQLELDRPAGW
jgi:hypothetical protein